MTGDGGAQGFTLEAADIALPRGAFAGGERRVLRLGDRPVAAFTQGAFRPYLHPVWTPSGAVATAERPADHPHHSGVWCAADHVGLLTAGPDAIERYDYNFYVDDVFQGRAPGRQMTTDIQFRDLGAGVCSCAQRIEWRGPVEWAAPQGRLVLTEERVTTVSARGGAHRFDIVSTLSAHQIDVEIGPTRHAYFNVRLADAIGLDASARPRDDQGRVGGAAIGETGAAWIDFSGPVGHGRSAGVAVAPQAMTGPSWFAADWGVVTVGPMRRRSVRVAAGEAVSFGCRFVAYDDALPLDILADATFPTEIEGGSA